MNNPNPFVPQGSLLEQQTKRQFRMKFAVSCVLAVSVTGLLLMLIQGCKRTPSPNDNGASDTTQATNVDNTASSPVSNDTNSLAEASNNVPTPISNNIPPVAIPAPISVPPPVVTPSPVVEVPSAGAEYVVVHGDTLAKIAKKNGVSVKALENANPSVQPTKLKVGQKLTLPAGGKPVSDTSAASPGFSSGMPDISSEVYVVKTGDTLTKIAKSHGTTVKALEAANNLSTTRITVGKKLKIPVKGEAAAPAAPAEAVSAPVAPGTTPASVPNFTPVTTPTAAPTH